MLAQLDMSLAERENEGEALTERLTDYPTPVRTQPQRFATVCRSMPRRSFRDRLEGKARENSTMTREVEGWYNE